MTDHEPLKKQTERPVAWGGMLRGVIMLVLIVIAVPSGVFVYERVITPLRIASTKRTIFSLAEEIEAYRGKTGNIPENESSLEKFRGAAMPLSSWGSRIEYHRFENRYEIIVMTEGFAAMFYEYRSDGDGTVRRTPF